MSIKKTKDGKYEVRWYEGGRHPQRTFDRQADAKRWDDETRRCRQLGTLATLTAAVVTLDQYVMGEWNSAHAPMLAPKTRQTYSWAYDKHIGPRVGTKPLHELKAPIVARLQSDLLAAGAGHHGTRKAMMMLSSVLSRAAEAELIPHNPVRVIRKAKAPLGVEVRPLAPVTVEAMRAGSSHRDATILSSLAYAGLRPQELRGLDWPHVGEQTLVVGAPKTHSRRSVRLLAPLAADLAEWRMACGRPDDGPVFPGQDGERWTSEGYNKWRDGRARERGGPRWGFAKALAAAGIEHARPYDLRHSFVSLLLHEGRNVIYVARQLGHGADQTLKTYGHVIEELDGAPHVSAEEAIRTARAAATVRPEYVSAR